MMDSLYKPYVAIHKEALIEGNFTPRNIRYRMWNNPATGEHGLPALPLGFCEKPDDTMDEKEEVIMRK
jgi:hypothetical protein